MWDTYRQGILLVRVFSPSNVISCSRSRSDHRTTCLDTRGQLARQAQYRLPLVSATLIVESQLTRSTLISIALEVIIWTIPDLITSATCFSLLGFFLAPLYPILIMIVVDVLPADIHAGTIGWVASLGCAGSALMPL